MRPLAQVVLTAVLVATGLVAYHFVVHDGASPTAALASASGVRPAGDDLERRVEALELRPGVLVPALAGSTSPDDLALRVRRLEQRLESLAPGRSGGTAPSGLPDAAQPRSAPDGAPADGADDDPAAFVEGGTLATLLTPSQRRTFENLVDDALDSRGERQQWRRAEERIQALGIELSADQAQKVQDAMGARRKAISDAFQKVRATGVQGADFRDQLGEARTQADQTFTQTLSTFLAAPDAEAVSKALTSPGGGRGAFFRGPGGGRGGRDAGAGR